MESCALAVPILGPSMRDQSEVIRVSEVTADTFPQVRIVLRPVEHFYPHFGHWVDKTVVPGLRDGSRAVFAAVSDREPYFVGILIAKRTLHERKVCTLFVLPSHSGRGIGTKLLSTGIAWLGQPRPLITVSEKRIGYFASLFRAYDFRLTGAVADLYQPGEVELIYNGVNLGSLY